MKKKRGHLYYFEYIDIYAFVLECTSVDGSALTFKEHKFLWCKDGDFWKDNFKDCNATIDIEDIEDYKIHYLGKKRDLEFPELML